MNKTTNISMTSEQFDKITLFCKANSLTRSEFFVRCALSYIHDFEYKNDVKALRYYLQKVYSDGSLSDDDKSYINELSLRLDSRGL